MLYREIIAVCSEIHTKHINTLCGQNVEFRTPRAVNTLRLSYKNQPVNAVQWNNRCLFSDSHKTHKCTVWTECRIMNVKLVVHIVATGLWEAKVTVFRHVLRCTLFGAVHFVPHTFHKPIQLHATQIAGSVTPVAAEGQHSYNPNRLTCTCNYSITEQFSLPSVNNCYLPTSTFRAPRPAPLWQPPLPHLYQT